MRAWLAALTVFCGCQPPDVEHPADGIPPISRQVVVVRPGEAVPGVTVALWERHGDAWTLRWGPVDGVVGSAGIAPVAAKREGDKRTPAGVFPLGPAFGAEPTADTGLEYFHATESDYWIDDPRSPQYNRPVCGPKPDCSHEVMRRSDHQYTLGAVIGYNTERPVAGRGSAIFLHIWRAPGQGTDGCVALEADHVRQLLRQLNRHRHPVVAIVPDGHAHQSQTTFSSTGVKPAR